MIGGWVRRRRAVQLAALVDEQRAFYDRPWQEEERGAWQLQRFNEQWSAMRQQVPYFARLQQDHQLTDRFSSWDEFQRLMPAMTRQTLQQQGTSLANRTKTADYVRTTGGSTAQPIQLPAWHSENRYADRDSWYARSWFGIRPDDRLFLIWGHSHLLGRGVRGWLNGRRRILKDWLAGYLRWSAYDLSEQKVRAAASALLRFRPGYIVAYAGALDRFARLNAERRGEFHAAGLKAAIATAEAFPREDSSAVIADVLGCPVVMEYGAVETGPIAHQSREGAYHAFWRHYYISGQPSALVPGGHELEVTALYPRCCPLVRYRIGDIAVGEADALQRQWRTVVGRCNDFIVLADGTQIHSEAFTHAVKESAWMLDFQVRQGGAECIVLNFTARAPIDAQDIAEVRRRLTRIDARLARTEIVQVEQLEQTIAGKTRRIRREQ